MTSSCPSDKGLCAANGLCLSFINLTLALLILMLLIVLNTVVSFMRFNILSQLSCDTNFLRGCEPAWLAWTLRSLALVADVQTCPISSPEI